MWHWRSTWASFTLVLLYIIRSHGSRVIKCRTKSRTTKTFSSLWLLQVWGQIGSIWPSHNLFEALKKFLPVTIVETMFYTLTLTTTNLTTLIIVVSLQEPCLPPAPPHHCTHLLPLSLHWQTQAWRQIWCFEVGNNHVSPLTFVARETFVQLLVLKFNFWECPFQLQE